MKPFQRSIDMMFAGESRIPIERDQPMLRCAYCAQSVAAERADLLPFCSVRCQQLDLSKWLDERHGLPWECEDESDFGTDDE